MKYISVLLLSLFILPFSAIAVPLAKADMLLDDSGGTVLLDTRGMEAYKTGHIPNSIVTNYGDWRVSKKGLPGYLLSVPAMEALIQSLGIDKDSRVIVISGINKDFDFGRAARVYWSLKISGITNVSILDGGIDAWKRAGGAISTTTSTPTPSSYTIGTYGTSLLATEKEVQQAIENQTAQIVDARPKNFFDGFIKHIASKIGGTIRSSVNISQFDFIASDGTLIPKEEMEAIAEQAGITPSAPVVSYCNTGHWAATNWFVFSEILGYRTKLYDGSFVEWSKSRKNRKKYISNTKTKQELRDFEATNKQ